MTKLTRRGFLGRTSLGVATLGMLTAAPALAKVPHASNAPAAQHSADPAAAPVLAHVRNRATGEIALMVGTREIVYRDPALVARLLKAAR